VIQAQGNMPSLPLSEEYCPRHLCPPIFYGMTDQQIDHVGFSLIDVVEGLKPVSI